ncbi:hypothetical protein LCGC14_0455790 [marine sediment metagenome]|uniref:Helix-turn-helix domain-containing protein n=1 Tax=marine sediment metagenome TaxID=412755 RepID=A0A0F9VQF9_9ZZZZ
MTRRSKQAEFLRTKGYVRATKAAQLVRVSPSAIYRMLEQETLDGTKIGGRWYVTLKSLIEYCGSAAKEFGLLELQRKARAR